MAIALTAACGQASGRSATTASNNPSKVTATEKIALLPECTKVSVSLVHVALGLSDTDQLVGPVPASGSCNWHAGLTGCALRSMSIEVHKGSSAGGFAGAMTGAFARYDLARTGQKAFYSSERQAGGAPISIERLDIRESHQWVRLTLLGRLDRESARRFLLQLADEVAPPQLS